MEEKEIVSLDDASTSSATSEHASKESWYGMILIGVILIVIISMIGLMARWGYTSVFRASRETKTSITALPRAESETAIPKTKSEPDQKSSQSVPETKTMPNAQEEVVAVLNGGGPGGVAGKVAALLKQASYTKVSIGNTKKDYTGVTVYFASGKDGVAAEVKKVLLKQYPKTTSQEAPKTDPEASSSAIVVIIGK